MHIFFDADGTLLEEENIYMNLAQYLGCYDLFEVLVSSYLRGDISYKFLVNTQVRILKEYFARKYNRPGTRQDFVDILDLAEDNFHKEAHEIASFIRNNDETCYVLSSGLDLVVNQVLQLGFKSKNVFVNELIFDKNSNFADIKVNIEGDKVNALKKIIAERNIPLSEVAYVGNDIWDKKVINYILKNGGSVYYMLDPNSNFQLDEFPKSKNFHVISNLMELEEILSIVPAKTATTLATTY